MTQREWVILQLQDAGLQYGRCLEGTYGRRRAKILLDGFGTMLDILDEEDVEQQILNLRFGERQ